MVEPVTSKKKKEYTKANRRYFTEENVLAIKPKRGKQFLIWDAWEARKRGVDPARGLAILVSPTGTKSYRCVYYFAGSCRPHYLNLGRVGEITLEEARARTMKARADAEKGIDPRADDPKRSDEFAVAVADYIKLHQIGKLGNKSATETEKVMLKSCPEEWHQRPVGTIRSQEVEDLLCLIRDGDAKKGLKRRRYLSLRLHAHLKDFFAWCVRRKTIKISPMLDMARPWKGAKPRDRIWFKKEPGDEAIISLWSLTPLKSVKRRNVI